MGAQSRVCAAVQEIAQVYLMLILFMILIMVVVRIVTENPIFSRSGMGEQKVFPWEITQCGEGDCQYYQTGDGN